MTIQEWTAEELEQQLAVYEKKMKKRRRIQGLFLCMVSVIATGIFLYLRLFNTDFNITYRGLEIHYSTAWVIRVPAEYEGRQMKYINSDYLFYTNCPYTRYVYIEDGYEELGEAMFWKSEIIGVRLPGTLKCIGGQAFENCDSLRTVIMEEPSEVIDSEDGCEIGWFAFAYCDKLEEFTMPNTITQMGEAVFAQCENLKSVTLSSSLDILPVHTFYGCEKLRELRNTDNLRCVSMGALYETQITQEQLPDNMYFYSWGPDVVWEEEGEYKQYRKKYRFSESFGTYDVISADETEQTWIYDRNKHAEYIAEKTEIPTEVLLEPSDSDRVWIEGQYYTLPMKKAEFMASDEWTLMKSYTNKEENLEKLKHDKSGYTIVISVDDTGDENVIGIYVGRPDADSEPCTVVLPGGITNIAITDWNMAASRMSPEKMKISVGDDYGTGRMPIDMVLTDYVKEDEESEASKE